MNDPRYIKDQGRFVLYMGSQCLYQTEEIGIVFDADFVVLKHGDYDLTHHWFLVAFHQFLRNGFQELAHGLRLISSSHWDPEELTKIVNCTGYLKHFLENELESTYRETRIESASDPIWSSVCN